MAEVRCEQLVYTWHSSTLHGSAGHGVVLQSSGWPGKLGLPGGTHSELTGAVPEGSGTQVFCLRTQEGTLFGARTSLGIDGSGRPGNFLCHLIFDPSAQIGILDALQAGANRQFVTWIAPEMAPNSRWEQAIVTVDAQWEKSLVIAPEPPPRADDPMRFIPTHRPDLSGLAPVYDSLVSLGPAALINEVSLVSGNDTSLGLPSPQEPAKVLQALGSLGKLSTEAAELGAATRWAGWWKRLAWPESDWATQLRFVVLSLRSPADLSIPELVEVGQQGQRRVSEYASELVTRLEVQETLQVPPMEEWFAEEVLVAAVERGSSISVSLATDGQLIEMIQSGVLGRLPDEAVPRLATGEKLPPADLMRMLLPRPDFWDALRGASRAHQEKVADWLASRGGFKVPEWYAPVLIRRCTDEFERLYGKMPPSDAYERIFSMVGDDGAMEVLTAAGDLDAWALALAKRGRRKPEPKSLAHLVRTFNALAEQSTGIESLRLTTTIHQKRTRVLVLSLLSLLLVAIAIATWGLMT